MWVWLFCIPVCGAVELPKEVQPAREEFEEGLKKAEQQGQERVTTIGEAYLKRLRELSHQQQLKGRFRGLVTVRDEIARFTKVRTFPDRPTEEPVELREAQASFQLKLQQTQYSNDFAIVKLAERYVQTLAVANEALEKNSSTQTTQAVESECERVIALPRLRQALEVTKVRPPTAQPKAHTGAAASAGNNDTRTRRPLDLFRPDKEPLASTINYEAKVWLYEDASQLKARKSAGAGSMYRSLDGLVNYAPRITLTCHNGEILSGSRLVIEYFSRTLPEHNLKREAVERLTLPRLERAKSFTMETKGLQLNRSESVSVQQYAGVSVSNFGAEFYGIILHLVDPDGQVLWQRFSPQALERELAATPPDK
jgi:hypothetical protein